MPDVHEENKVGGGGNGGGVGGVGGGGGVDHSSASPRVSTSFTLARRTSTLCARAMPSSQLFSCWRVGHSLCPRLHLLPLSPPLRRCFRFTRSGRQL
jgi:hypothetical protein